MTNDQTPMTRQKNKMRPLLRLLVIGHWSFSRRLGAAVSLWLTALALAGCTGTRTSPVEGVVLLDGKPVADASIQFVPQGTGRDATGQTDKNGAFKMSTYVPDDGVVAGSYKVVIAPPLGTPDPKQYASAEDAMNAASSAPPPKASTFPQKYTRVDQTQLKQEVPVSGKLTFEMTSK